MLAYLLVSYYIIERWRSRYWRTLVLADDASYVVGYCRHGDADYYLAVGILFVNMVVESLPIMLVCYATNIINMVILIHAYYAITICLSLHTVIVAVGRLPPYIATPFKSLRHLLPTTLTGCLRHIGLTSLPRHGWYQSQLLHVAAIARRHCWLARPYATAAVCITAGGLRHYAVIAVYATPFCCLPRSLLCCLLSLVSPEHPNSRS